MIGMVKGTMRETKSVAGLPSPIASFRTNASGLVLPTLKTTIEAVQSGSGDPYPAGGGKNKLSYVAGTTTSANNITMIINDDGSVKATSSGTSTGPHFFLYNTIYLPVGTYYLYATVNGTAWAYDPNGKFRIYVAYDGLGYNFGGTLNVTDASKAIIVYVQGFGNKTFNDTVNPMICEGSTAPTAWTPYSNIRPISGWTEANLSRVGSKNLLNNVNPTVYNAYISGANILVSNANNRTVLLPIKPFTDYTYTWNRVSIASSDNSGVLLFENEPVLGTTVGTFVGSYISSSGGHVSFNSDANRFCAIKMANINNTDFEATLSASQLEFGLSATSFEPYSGTTVTLQFGTTIYGGSIDWTSGVVTVTHQIVDLGSLSWNTPANRSTYYGLANIIKAPINAGVLCGAIAEKYHEVPSNSSLTTDGQFAVGTNGYLYFYRVTDTPTGMFVYPLATATTIQLTPQQIEQLRGENNVFVDCGEVSELKYQNMVVTKLFSKG